MIEHSRYREAVLADPHSTDAELRAHRDACAECREFSERLLKFESRLERALRVALPEKTRLPPFAARTRSWMALAASVLLGVAIVGGVWLTLPQRSLAAAVVAHMAGEPDAWRTETAVAGGALQDVLKDSKLELKPSAGIVSYASSCEFRGHRVPHLVVQTPSGPVTVMVLVHEPVRKAVQFDEQGYRGTIVPVPGHGSIAVLMRDPSADRDQIARIAARVDDSIIWKP
ncbi:MAG TPA: DUF3379 family protein [Steroidobacteraceae bacterium]|jgi:hypothetical protein|nr:DUF3379 family protein [Steroidobacteraceae bacterium]